MSHYQKLAIVLLRSLACILLFFALCGIASGFAAVMLSGDPYAIYCGLGYLLMYAVYGLAGTVLIVLSKPLAALIARKL